MSMSVSQSFGSFNTTQTQSRPPPPPPRPDETGESTSPGEDMLALLDIDESGGLSSTEIDSSQLAEMIGDDFASLDIDGDGSLNESELTSHAESLMQSGSMPPPPPPPPATSDADLTSLFEGLFASLDGSEAATTDAAGYAEEIYSMMQEMFPM